MQATPLPSEYPICATDGCTNRSRSRKLGGLCMSCRRAAGDTSVLCETEGCTNLRGRRGLCRVCFERYDGAGRPYRRQPNPQRATCARPGCPLRPHSHHSRCGKHRVNWDACVMRRCAQPIVDGDRCDSHRLGEEGTCQVRGCPKPRFKARFCFRHYREQNPRRCAREGCTSATTGTYCRPHDVGIDFAAGDWFDWVALEQLWEGRLDPARKPTIPELEALFDRAERFGLGNVGLARRTGLDAGRVNAWRLMLSRAERQGADIAREAA